MRQNTKRYMQVSKKRSSQTQGTAAQLTMH